MKSLSKSTDTFLLSEYINYVLGVSKLSTITSNKVSIAIFLNSFFWWIFSERVQYELLHMLTDKG